MIKRIQTCILYMHTFFWYENEKYSKPERAWAWINKSFSLFFVFFLLFYQFQNKVEALLADTLSQVSLLLFKLASFELMQSKNI